MRFATMLAWAATALLLTGCGSDAASYLIDGPDHSLTLLREQRYFWSRQWDLSLVTTHEPACMRRHPLQPAAMDGFKLEVFHTPDDRYILKQGNRWYVTETQKCRLQMFQKPPPEPGEPLGTFEVKDKRLQFVAAAKPPVAAAAVPKLPAATPPAAPSAPR